MQTRTFHSSVKENTSFNIKFEHADMKSMCVSWIPEKFGSQFSKIRAPQPTQLRDLSCRDCYQTHGSKSTKKDANSPHSSNKSLILNTSYEHFSPSTVNYATAEYMKHSPVRTSP